jgi:hypothetical protein
MASMIGVLLLTPFSTPHPWARTKETKLLVLAPTQADAVLEKYKEQGWVFAGIMTGSPASPTGQQCGYLLKRQSK